MRKEKISWTWKEICSAGVIPKLYANVSILQDPTPPPPRPTKKTLQLLYIGKVLCTWLVLYYSNPVNEMVEMIIHNFFIVKLSQRTLSCNELE